MNNLKMNSNLTAALTALTFAVALAPTTSAQCVSGIGGTHNFGMMSADISVISGTIGARTISYAFKHPLKIIAGGAGINVLDETPTGTQWVEIGIGTDAATGLQEPVLEYANLLGTSPVVDLLTPATGQAAFRSMYASGVESLVDPLTAKPFYSIQVTRNSVPVAIVNAGGYDWVTDGSGVLYRVSLPASVSAGSVVGTGSVTQFNLGPNFTLGEMAYDGLHLLVVSGTNMLQVDPATGTVVGGYSNAGHIAAMAFDGTYLWTGDNSGVRKFDPLTMQMVIDHPQSISGPVTGLYFDGSWLWAADGTSTIERTRACDAANMPGMTLPASAQSVTMTSAGVWFSYSNSPMISVR